MTQKTARSAKREKQSKTMERSASTKAPKSTVRPKLSAWDKTRVRLGAGGSQVASAVLSGVVFVIAIAAIGVLAIGMASRMVPDVVMSVIASMPVPDEPTVEVLLVQWGLPAVFLTAVLVLVYWAVVKGIWRVAMRVSGWIGSKLHPVDSPAPNSSTIGRS